MARQVVIVDDSSALLATIRQAIEASDLDIVLQDVRSEFDFIESIGRWAANPPSAFVIDVMLRWVRPLPDSPQRPDWYRDDSRFRAGIRCARRLHDNRSLNSSPVIFYTVLDRSDVVKDLKEEPFSFPIFHKDDGFSVLFRALDRIAVDRK
jgi:CheY-like chemotaxis protein